ncbi:DUF2065 domain-containing protein [Thioclava sp. BHET1]|nr:DUF2065 domain-containing protein [Thioclava sp. BHET1]
MTMLLLAIGLVLAVEGFVLALAPGRLEQVLALLIRLPIETRRMLGLVVITIGVVLIWLVRGLGA